MNSLRKPNNRAHFEWNSNKWSYERVTNFSANFSKLSNISLGRSLLAPACIAADCFDLIKIRARESLRYFCTGCMQMRKSKWNAYTRKYMSNKNLFHVWLVIICILHFWAFAHANALTKCTLAIECHGDFAYGNSVCVCVDSFRSD